MSGTVPRVEWEYLTFPEAERDRLAALGRDGWELVGIGGSGDERLLYLKRGAADFRERVTREQRSFYYESLGLDPNDPRERAPE